MKLPLLLVSLTLLPAFALPIQSIPHGDRSDPDSDLVGTYECQGTKPNGTPYRGTVQIARHNGTYHLRWSFSPREQYLGIGIANEHVLAVSYFGTEPGVVVYRIERGDSGPRLIGQWTVIDADGKVFVETLKRLTREVSAPALPEPPRGRPVPLRGLKSA